MSHMHGLNDSGVSYSGSPNTPELDVVHSLGVTRSYPKDTNIINEGDESDSLYVILVGEVKVYVSNEEGGEATLRYMGPGEYFGELAVFSDAPRSASVRTTMPSRLSYVSRKEFRQCMERNPQLCWDMLCLFTNRIRDLTAFAKSLALYDVYGRIRNKLYELANTKEDGTVVIEQRLTHQEIANMVGSGREMVSRVLSTLKEGEYIEVSRDKKITILKSLPLHF